MQGSHTSKEDLTKIRAGVLQSCNTNGPNKLCFEGVNYHRFMDGFYIEGAPNDLTVDQVIALCRARIKNPALIKLGAGNEVVKHIISKYLIIMKPTTLLEIGSGIEPVLMEIPDSSHYVLSDVDNDIVEQNNASGKECVEFGEESSLPYCDGYFEIIVAVFVFHFRIYPNQIDEISRCLKPSGVLLANVYHLDESERQCIISSFSDKDFQVERIKDPLESCKQNEYWIFSKDIEALLGNKTQLQSVFEKELINSA